LELCAVALAAGALRVDLLLWRPGEQGRAYRARTEPQRLRPLYYQAWAQALAAWPAGRWRLHPDQRTGMQWQRWPAPLKRRLNRGGRSLSTLAEAQSQRSACVQLADLLAGLARLGAQAPAAPDSRRRLAAPPDAGADQPGDAAHRNRLRLLESFRDALRRRGAGLPLGPGLLNSRHPLLHARLMKRLPTRA
jgi:hypothetical protein